MKKTLIFNLPADREEYEQALNVGKYYNVVSDYAQLLQESMQLATEEAKYARWAYNKLIEELRENGMLELFDVR